MKQCNSCGGIYAAVLPDGVQYFHVCPPVPRQRVILASRKVADLESARHEERTTDATGAVTVTRTFTPPLPDGAIWLDEVFVPRPNGRNENIQATRGENAGKVIADGLGAIDLPDA